MLWVQYPGDTTATRTEYAYDDMYRLIETSIEPTQNVEMSATYTYHKDLLASITTGSNTTYTITYGDFNLCKTVQVGSRPLVTYHYSHEDPEALETDRRKHNLERLDYGNGDSVEYTYDYLGRVTSEIYYENGSDSISRIIEYSYTNAGAVARMKDSATDMETFCTYDGAGRVAAIVETNNENFWHAVLYFYDENGNIIGMQEITEGFDKEDDNVTSPAWLYAITYKYLYDYKNRLASIATDNTKKEYCYDGLDRLTEEIVSKVNATDPIFSNRYTYADITVEEDGSTKEYASNRISDLEILADNYHKTYEYEYDANGNITSISDGTYTTTYQYDAANQLIRENNQAIGKTWRWTYDNAGNILSKEEFTYTTGPLGAASTHIEYGYDSEVWGDLLTSYDGRTFHYDGSGNLINDGTHTYTWEQGRQLASMSNGISTWTFDYDANGMRTRRGLSELNSYWYVYNGTQLSAMTYTIDKLFFTYDAAGRPLTLEYHCLTDCGIDTGYACGSQCETYYYVTNLQGDVIALLNDDGYPVVEYAYDAWGNVVDAEDNSGKYLAMLNPLRYRGYVYDWETGLYYLQSRYYDPEIGRFISADSYASTGQGILGNNMFSYCNNNPVLMYDPTGELGIVTLMIIGAVVGAGIEYASQVIKNHKAGLTGAEAWTPSNYGALAASAFSGALSAIPGAGSFLATAADIVGSAVIEQGVNSLCYGTKWSWSKLGEDVIGNIGGAFISKRFKLAEDVPQYLRHIKSEAREIGIKGTRKLTKYLNAKQVLVIVKNSFNTATLGELIP